MAVKCYFEVVEGPRQGEKLPLTAGEGTLVGRTKQGIDLLDPRVSTRHAEVTWDEDRFWIKDLGSATGTLVDGIAIGQEPVPLSAGTRVLIGDSVLAYTEDRRLVPQWVYWVALVVLAVCTPFFMQTVIDLNLWDRLHPTIEAPEVVNHHRGFLSLTSPKEVELDRCFMRETGATPADVSIRRVTDWDGDGVSEIWIEGWNWERVYTFDPDGNWLLLGELPKGCQNTDGATFRPMTCGDASYAGRRYIFKEGVPFRPGPERCARGSNKGHYALDRFRGAIAWVPEGPGGDPRPWHMNVKDVRRALPQWLGERNISGTGIHFIVCEEMHPGMSAQVLTTDGRIEKLEPGCTGTLDIISPMVDARYGRQRPVAIALTETGRQLLLEQLNIFLGGSEHSHFQNGGQRAWWRAVSRPPQAVTSDLLVFKPGPQAPNRFFDPIATEAPLQLNDYQRLGGLVVPGKRRADDWTWAGGESVLRTPCDTYVQVETADWRCGPPCFKTTKFMRITQVNGPTWELPYADMRGHRLYGDEVEVSVDLRTAGPGMVPQIVYASVSARDTKMCGTRSDVELPNLPIKGREDEE